LRGVKKLPLKFYKPIGATDSEHAFCWLLEQLRMGWRKEPRLSAIDAAVGEHFAALEQLGGFNALLGDGRTLYAHCSKTLCYLTRPAPLGRAAVADEDVHGDFSAETTPKDVVTIVATQPLTKDEEWVAVSRGRTLIFRDGEVVKKSASR